MSYAPSRHRARAGAIAALGALPKQLRSTNVVVRKAPGGFASPVQPAQSTPVNTAYVGNASCTHAQLMNGTCGTGGPINPGGSSGGGGSGGGGGGGGSWGGGSGWTGGWGGRGPSSPGIMVGPPAPDTTVVVTAPPQQYVCPDGTVVSSADMCMPVMTTSPSVWDQIVSAAKSIPWWVYAAGGGYLLLRKKNSP